MTAAVLTLPPFRSDATLGFELGGRVEMAIEIKRATAPTLSRGFHLARNSVEAREAYLVHGGQDTWPMPGEVIAISLVGLMNKLTET